VVRDEDSCTRQGLTFCRSVQSVVAASERVEVGIEVMVGVGTEIGKD
jgi:hypothetical protein